MKTIEELKNLELKKLLEELTEMAKNLFKIKFDANSNQSKSTHLIKRFRRQIARIKTYITIKNLEEQKAKKEVEDKK